MKIRLVLIFCLLCHTLPGMAQKYASELIIINDTTIGRFTDINELHFLYSRGNNTLQRLVKKLSKAKNQHTANTLIKKIAMLRSEGTCVILGMDYFFSHSKPVVGSNVERVLHYLKNSRCYDYINEYYFQNGIDANLSQEEFKKAIQDTIGWRYGYGAFYYLSEKDATYLAKMKKHNVDEIDVQIENIIDDYLRLQSQPFKYDDQSIIKDVLNIKDVKDALWDNCLTKTMQLPNWDQLGVLIVKDGDTIERVYTIQYSYYSCIRLGKHFTIPLKNNTDTIWYTGVTYGLHFIERTRKQCIANELSKQQ